MAAWNPFLGGGTAATYAAGRPDYHPRAVAALRQLLDLRSSVGTALDLGCGTGMSARALLAVAERVIGVDVSRPMLTEACSPSPGGVHYVEATAERLPVRDAAADLVVAAAAFHWFDQPAMLGEVARVLRAGGAFVVYTDSFRGSLGGATAAEQWLADTYRTRFPAPARRRPFDEEAATAAGLRFVGHAELAYEVPMTADALTAYLMSQSNATSGVDAGRTTAAALGRWLRTELTARMPDGPVPVGFTAAVWACRATRRR